MVPSSSLILLVIVVAMSVTQAMVIDNAAPTVDLKQGKAFGIAMTSTEGRPFNGFLGIPYGKIVQRFQVGTNVYLSALHFI